MLARRFKKPQMPAVAQTLAVPAPVGGLNARDALALMPPTDAVTLENFFPGTSDVSLRKGYVKWSTGYPAAVESLMTYNGYTSSKLVAASGTAFYDATAQGAVGAPEVTGLTNARWQYANMGTPGGQFLVCVNGADYPQLYDGTVWKPYAGVGSQPIIYITNSGTTATLAASAPIGLTTGDYVTVSGATPAAYNGTFQITVLPEPGFEAIASITHVTTTATLTTAVPHALPLGMGSVITVSGASPAPYNGTFAVNVTGANTLTYTMLSDPGSNATVNGSYVVDVNKFSYTMLSDPGGSATVVGTYTVSPSVTGVDPRKLITVNTYATRLFFVEKDSARCWYLPVNSIGGAALSLDFSSLFVLGGYLMTMATWTVDNVNGIIEYAVFISSEGEVLMYSGTDPAVAENWRRAGRFRIGRPVGRRCFERVNSDVIVLTSNGAVPLSKALLTDRSQSDAISDKITNLISSDLDNYNTNFGWEATLYPKGNKLLINVPQRVNSTQYQYVMNSITGAWAKFTGWKANTFATMGEELYFGGNLGNTPNTAYVGKADTGFSDDGGYIFGDAKTSFQYFGAPGRQKQIVMARPIFMTSGNLQAAIALDMDFADNLPKATPTFSGGGGTLWGTKLWGTFLWSTSGSIKKDWQGLTGVGDCAALHMRIVNNMTATKWPSVEYIYRLGGFL